MHRIALEKYAYQIWLHFPKQIFFFIFKYIIDLRKLAA